MCDTWSQVSHRCDSVTRICKARPRSQLALFPTDRLNFEKSKLSLNLSHLGFVGRFPTKVQPLHLEVPDESLLFEAQPMGAVHLGQSSSY